MRGVSWMLAVLGLVVAFAAALPCTSAPPASPPASPPTSDKWFKNVDGSINCGQVLIPARSPPFASN